MHPTDLDTDYPERCSFTDLTGETLGLLRVERYAGRRDTSYYWQCRCECGERTVVEWRSLRRGRTRTCGDRARHPTRGRSIR